MATDVRNESQHAIDRSSCFPEDWLQCAHYSSCAPRFAPQQNLCCFADTRLTRTVDDLIPVGFDFHFVRPLSIELNTAGRPAIVCCSPPCSHRPTDMRLLRGQILAAFCSPPRSRYRSAVSLADCTFLPTASGLSVEDHYRWKASQAAQKYEPRLGVASAHQSAESSIGSLGD